MLSLWRSTPSLAEQPFMAEHVGQADQTGAVWQFSAVAVRRRLRSEPPSSGNALRCPRPSASTG